MKISLALCFALFTCLAAPLACGFPAYHDISDTASAQAEARQRNLPLAYLGSFPECLSNGSPNPGSQADLTQMALATLQDHAVVIFFDGRNMAPVPAIVHAQYHIPDDGPLPNGAAWTSPKIVFANAEITKTLGRVSYTQMAADRDVPINSALQIIRNDPTALAAPPVDPNAAAPGTSDSTGTATNALAAVTWLSDNSLYLAIGLGVLLAGLIFGLARGRR